MATLEDIKGLLQAALSEYDIKFDIKLKAALDQQKQDLLSEHDIKLDTKLKAALSEYDIKLDTKLKAALSEHDIKLKAALSEHDIKFDIKLKAALDQQKKELLSEVDSKLDAAVKPLRSSVSILTAKHSNACLAGAEKLVKVPRPDGVLPTVAYPDTILNLLVAGNEKLPDGTPNNWSKKKTYDLLKEYDADVGYMSDEDNEYTELSRTRRLKLARVLGVSQAQLNYAQLSL